ncbi:MAG: DUF6159 family protein [Candidatus Heimdallarchaeota archaeon]|nr:DUF6159 family protein [Candidatus Heimdallarchaeota archaeon]
MSVMHSTSPVMETDDKTITGMLVGLTFLIATAGILGFISSNTNIFEKLSTVFLQILLGISIIFLLAIFANYKALDLLQDHARIILFTCWRLIFITFGGFFALIGLLILPGSFIGGAIFLGIAGLIFGIYLYTWRFVRIRLERSAEWITIATTVVLKEPGMIGIAIIQSIIISITAVMEIFTIWAWNSYATEQAVNQNNAHLIAYGIMFIYLWISFSVLYFYDGANTVIAYIRIKGGDPTVGQGFSASFNKFFAIIGFALITTTVTVIVRALKNASNRNKDPDSRKSDDNIAAAILMAFLSVFGAMFGSIILFIYNMMTFFTLPAIVIRNKGTLAAMGESKDLFNAHAWDIVFGDTGYGFASFAMYIFSGGILGFIGFIYGYFVISASSTIIPAFWFGIIMAIIALAIGWSLTKFFLRPLYTSIVTTMYVYATEGPAELKIVPDSLKTHINQTINSPRGLPIHMRH